MRVGSEEEHLLLQLLREPLGLVACETRHKRGYLGSGLGAKDINRLWKLRRKGLVERVNASLRRWMLTEAGLAHAKVLAVKARLVEGG